MEASVWRGLQSELEGWADFSHLHFAQTQYLFPGLGDEEEDQYLYLLLRCLMSEHIVGEEGLAL